jgi:hypothetical protein
MTCAHSSSALRRSTAGLFVGGAFAFAVAATQLSSAFDRSDVLRRPGDVVLPAVGWSATLGVIVVRTLVLPRRIAVLRRPAVPAAPDVVPATTRRAAAPRG